MDDSNLTFPKLILASSSPRRQSLLKEYGFSFEVQPPDDGAENGHCSGESPAQMVARLARQKAANVAARVDQGVVLAADTVASCVGQILGKPKDRDHAKQMLQLMSGRIHQVLTGVCLWSRPENKIVVHVECTDLKMDKLETERLEDYLDTDQWIGKAGAFGFQDGLDWVQIKKGESTNVVGLPIPVLKSLLEQFR